MSSLKKVGMIGVLMLSLQVWAQKAAHTKPMEAGENEPYIARIVAGYLAYNHFKRLKLDDAVSLEMFENYFEELDYNKIFFLASDIDRFRSFQYALDEMLLSPRPDLRLVFNIFDLYKQRLNERVEWAIDRLDQPFDFSVEESWNPDREHADWAKTPEEMNELWRLRLKDQVLSFHLRGKTTEETLALLKKRYQRLQLEVEGMETLDVLEPYLTALTRVFDPHSSYFKPTTKENFDIDMGHSLEGIGATLRSDGEYTIVVELTPGGPADLSGELYPGDKIIAVAQGEEEAVDVVDMRLDKVVRQIRGKKGTQVRLTVIPSDAIDPSKTKLVRITRDKVAITANDAKSEIHEIKSPGGQSYVFGVINVPGFYQDTRARYEGMAEYKSTTRDVERLLEEFKAKKVDAVVMDLRTNSGGSLDEAISLTGLFIDEGPVVQVLDRSGRKKEYRDRLPGVAWEGPMLVLTSPLSASASEIFAGAIQDYGRGLIVGSSSTHGKGTVQNLVGLNGILEQLTRNTFEDDVAGALKYTTHQFYRVSGSSTQVKGVESDIVLPSPFDRFGMREGELPKALAWNAIEPSSFEPVADLSEIITPLSERSKARVEANPEFQYLIHDLAYWKTKEDNPLTSLNQSKRKAENDEWEEIEAKRKKERDQRLTHVKKEDVVQKAPEADQSLASTEEVPDYLLEEALQILADYCHATGNKVAASTGGAKAGTFGDSERLHPNPRTP